MGRATPINELIDNDIESLHRRRSMTMTMKGYGVRDEKLAESHVDGDAEYLVKVFGTPKSKPLYCDVVRYLTRAYIDEQIGIAQAKGHNPAKLFNFIVYNKLRSLGLYAR